ncbi:MAG: 7-cyano-7-deazaguanine synthase QueC [Chloroflexi bacterium]|nr:7-cyano-7-deazaguanine synthase QueC [Chloroflexota bacterium]MCI0579505.1 7-cyano-7-deazaguanine synthase QueC [Chloroflexota bacterium]MCI0647283.1 7-cyano-7-deazaguanine synthase QueC [Chloroflexota bacterium]MCI0729322.1 7-cyano-7-deazaguanine synthase QueC [Chloroflexota bacterium]
MIDSVVIVSGGMDSVTLLHYLVKRERLNPAVITFVYGQKHAREIACARTHASLLNCAVHLVLDLSLLRPLFTSSALVSADIPVPTIEEVTGDPQPVTYVPNRNMIFLALAAAYAESHGATAVYYGAQRHDLYGYWDTPPQFLDSLNRVYQLNRKTPVQIHAPFVNYSKADILRLGLELGVDYSQTWSCYQGQEVACGRCPTCAERLQAFAEVGLPDPLPYVTGA